MNNSVYATNKLNNGTNFCAVQLVLNQAKLFEAQRCVKNSKEDHEMITTLLEGIVEILLRIIGGTFLFFTGELILFLFTLGKRTPTWKRDQSEHLAKTFLFMDISILIGFVFWIVVLSFAVKMFM